MLAILHLLVLKGLLLSVLPLMAIRWRTSLIGASALTFLPLVSIITRRHGRKFLILHFIGQRILSAYIGSDTASITWSGTASSSAHTAGLFAYFISIYPSKSFDPDVSAFVPSLVVRSVPQRAIRTIFSFARTALPSWMLSMLPPPALETVAPDPLLTLTPAQLTEALISLATPNALTKMKGLKTPNLLIFNNATGL